MSVDRHISFVRSFVLFLFPLPSFFFFLFLLLFLPSCPVLSVLSSFILKVSPSTSLTSLSFGGKRPSSIQQRFKKFSFPLPPPSLPDSSISSTSTELDRAVSGTDDRFERSTNVNQLQLSTAITNLLFITIIVITMFIIIINIIIRFFFSCLALLNIIY